MRLGLLMRRMSLDYSRVDGEGFVVGLEKRSHRQASQQKLLSDWGDWRGITLQLLPGKGFYIVLLDRLH